MNRLSWAAWILSAIIVFPLLQPYFDIAVLTGLAGIASVLALYYAWGDDSDEIERIAKHPVFIASGGFLLFHIIMLFFTQNLGAAVEGIGIWTTVYFASLAGCAVAREKHLAERIIRTAIMGGALYFFFGIQDFLTTQPVFLSVFYGHNLLAGALLIPLFLGLALFLRSQSETGKIIFGATSVLMAATLILSFSRGGILIFFLAILAVAVIHRKAFTRSFLIRLGSVVAVSIVIVLVSVFVLKPYIQKAESPDLGDIYAAETEEQNAVTARLSYFHTALSIFTHHPIVGVGMQNYSDGARQYRPDMEYYSADPHNSILRAIAEGGLIGGGFFIAWFLLIVWHAGKVLLQKKRNHWHTALAAGILASMLHTLMDVDWYYPLIVITFGIFSGVLVHVSRSREGETVRHANGNMALCILIFALAGLLWNLASIQSSIAHETAQVLQSKGKIDQSRQYYAKSIRWNPLSSKAHAGFAEMELTKGSADDALPLNERTISLDRDNYLHRSRHSKILSKLDRTDESRKSLKHAVSLNPRGALNETNTLIALALLEKNFAECVEFGEPFLQNYPARLFHTHYWQPPFKDLIRESIVSMQGMLATCHEQLGNKDKATEIRMNIKDYERHKDA